MAGPGGVRLREKIAAGLRAGREAAERQPERELAERARQPLTDAERKQKKAMARAIVFFIIGLSVIVSYEWGAEPPGFRPDAPNVILFGILVAAIIFIATNYAMEGAGAFRAQAAVLPRVRQANPV